MGEIRINGKLISGQKRLGAAVSQRIEIDWGCLDVAYDDEWETAELIELQTIIDEILAER